MKKIIIVVCVIIAVLLTVLLSATRKIDRTSFYESDYYKKSCLRLDSLKETAVTVVYPLEAGFAKVSITPGLNSPEDNAREGKFKEIPLAGYGARDGKPATGIHDSIFAKAAALKLDDKIMVIVGVDMLVLPPNIIDPVVDILHRDGINRGQLMFSATHSHSSIGGWGTGIVGPKFSGPENENVQHWVTQQIVAVVKKAIQDLKPATIGSDNIPAASYTRNRVIGDLGTKNDDFSYIVLEQIGAKKAVIGSFSAHSTTMGADNMEFSGDYPGYWQRKMEQSFADYAIFCAGSVGSQSPVTQGEGFARPQSLGEALADTVLAQIARTPMEDKVVFSTVTLKFDLPKYSFRILKKRSLIPSLSNKLSPIPDHSILQAIRLNNMVWVTTPADFSGEYALQLKNYLWTKGFKANVTSFNGNYVGYIVPGRYFDRDQYESRAMGWFGPSMGDYTFDMMRRISDMVIR